MLPGIRMSDSAVSVPDGKKLFAHEGGVDRILKLTFDCLDHPGNQPAVCRSTATGKLLEEFFKKGLRLRGVLDGVLKFSHNVPCPVRAMEISMSNVDSVGLTLQWIVWDYDQHCTA